jgi:type IV pilus assembly protein PilW
MPSNNEFMHRPTPCFEAGFSLIEIMVGLVIGLLATLVITQVFSIFEGQKRSTMGTADAQTNGSIALFNVQSDVQMAGYGLPLFDTINPPLLCNPSPTISVDHDNDATTPNIDVDIFPIRIVDGGTAAGASDSIYVRYGPTPMGGIAVNVISPLFGNVLGVDNNLGCQNNDVVLISNGASCALKRVTDSNAALLVNPQLITLNDITGLPPTPGGARVACVGGWNEYQYSISNSQLSKNNMAIVPGIINIQAQYGISATAASNVVTAWVDATGAYAAPTVANRNLIKAIRVAIVSRNDLLEKTDVTAGALTWAGSATTNGPIDLSNNSDWKRYRYRVFETIIPLRNMIWSGNTLS